MSKVYVGCKLPNGLWMELLKPHPQEKSTVPNPQTGPRVELKGANSAKIELVNPAELRYGVTLVDEDFAKAWFEANKDAPYVKEGQVFMVASEAAARSEIKDRTNDARTLTGLEPLRTDGKDKRLAGVKTDKNAGALATMRG